MVSVTFRSSSTTHALCPGSPVFSVRDMPLSIGSVGFVVQYFLCGTWVPDLVYRICRICSPFYAEACVIVPAFLFHHPLLSVPGLQYFLCGTWVPDLVYRICRICSPFYAEACVIVPAFLFHHPLLSVPGLQYFLCGTWVPDLVYRICRICSPFCAKACGIVSEV